MSHTYVNTYWCRACGHLKGGEATEGATAPVCHGRIMEVFNIPDTVAADRSPMENFIGSQSNWLLTYTSFHGKVELLFTSEEPLRRWIKETGIVQFEAHPIKVTA